MRGARRIGKFYFDADLIDPLQPESARFADHIRAVMACCVIVRAEMDFVSNRINYVAICPQFAEQEQGNDPPVYQWEIEQDPYLGQVTARVSRNYISKEALDLWLTPIRHEPPR